MESLLTPKQLTALKEIVFHKTAPDALADAAVREKVGLTREQRDAISRIRRDADGERRPCGSCVGGGGTRDVLRRATREASR